MTAGEFDSLFELLDLTPDRRQQESLTVFLDLLERWNGTYNLTSVRERPAMRLMHIADCLCALGPLQRQCPIGSFLDVGSGGGLPGVVLSIMQPERPITCIDAVGKKAAFIRQAASVLRLPRLRVVHGRAEDLSEMFDVIGSRAFGTVAELVMLTERNLAPAGVWMAMKGRYPTAEVAELEGRADVFHVEQVRVPGLDAERCLIWMRRSAPPESVVTDAGSRSQGDPEAVPGPALLAQQEISSSKPE